MNLVWKCTNIMVDITPLSRMSTSTFSCRSARLSGPRYSRTAFRCNLEEECISGGCIGEVFCVTRSNMKMRLLEYVCTSWAYRREVCQVHPLSLSRWLDNTPSCQNLMLNSLFSHNATHRESEQGLPPVIDRDIKEWWTIICKRTGSFKTKMIDTSRWNGSLKNVTLRHWRENEKMS